MRCWLFFNRDLSPDVPEAHEVLRFQEAARTSKRPVDELVLERAVNSPTGRVGYPAEFGDACAFLCSAKIGFIVGHNLILDGGNFNSSIA